MDVTIEVRPAEIAAGMLEAVIHTVTKITGYIKVLVSLIPASIVTPFLGVGAIAANAPDFDILNGGSRHAFA